METNTCTQCGKEFETWIRFEDFGLVEIGSYEESDVCSDECYEEWCDDNREELCN